MRTHRALRALTDTVKTYQPRHWTIDSSKVAYFNADSHREFHELSEAFDVLTGNRPMRDDSQHQCVSQWEWHDWRISLAVFVDAPTGHEATA